MLWLKFNKQDLHSVTQNTGGLQDLLSTYILVASSPNLFFLSKYDNGEHFFLERLLTAFIFKP
jgi:hypothetical protein